MTSSLCIVEQIALYLGPPWKINRTGEPCHWRFEITDGTGRTLIFYDNYTLNGKFRVSGHFPALFTSPHRDDYKTIGVGISRPPKDIAADVARRLIPHYLEAFDRARATHLQEKEAAQNIKLIGQAIIKVTDGRFADQSRSGCTIYFERGKAEIRHNEEVTLELRGLSPEIAVRIAAMVSTR